MTLRSLAMACVLACVLAFGSAAVPSAAAPEVIHKRTILVGDSISEQYGSFHAALYPGRFVVRTGGSGQDPSTYPWYKTILVARAGDTIVLQDYHADIDSDVATWQQAWRDLVAWANNSGARVVLSIGQQPSQHNEAFFATLPVALRRDMVAADLWDGVHYHYAGAQAEARSLEAFLVANGG